MLKKIGTVIAGIAILCRIAGGDRASPHHGRKFRRMCRKTETSVLTSAICEITGLSLTPNYLWLDDALVFFASTYPWGGIVRQGFEKSFKSLEEAQEAVQRKRTAEMARQFYAPA